MAKKKISELPAGGALNGTELVPIVQTGTTKRITAQDIANLGNASGVEGSGTINRLAKFTATSTIGNSQLFDDGTSVGLGTITPLGLLHLFKTSATTRMVMDGNAAQNRVISYRTNAVQRFGLYVNNTAESGANAGSDFAIRAYNDAGTLLSTPLFIKRSTGAATFSSSVTAQGANIGINALGTDRMFQISGNTFTTGATQFAAVINPTMGSVTNLYGIYAGLTCTSATNYYALYLETATGTITNKWGIYQSGSGEKNYFAGSVGIGTTSPSEILDVRNINREATNGEFTQLLSSTNSQDAGIGASLGFGGFTNGTSGYTTFSGLKGFKENGDGGNTAGTLAFYTRLNGGAIAERMRITSAGNVGIGTTSPASKLNVLGAGTTAISISNSNAGSSGTPELTQLNFLGFQQENRARIEAIDVAGSANGSQLRFYNANSSNTLAENMRIAASGNVLIGTTTDIASSKLTIESTTQGVLVPRMTTTQINAIGSPANGLIAYNTTLAVLCFYDGSGWKRVVHLAM